MLEEGAEGTPDVDVENQPVEDTAAVEESFTEITPDVPEGEEVTQEWLQERYKQMQADYTRKRQADAQAAKERAEELEFLDALRSDPETQRALYEELAEILAESDEYEELEEGEEPNELEQTVRQLQQAEEQRQAAQLASQITSHIEQLAKGANVELDEDDLSDLFDRAIAGGEVNTQTTEAAFKAWHAREQAKQNKWQKAYLASKQNPTQQIPGGQSATDKPDLSSREERIKRMAAILEGGN